MSDLDLDLLRAWTPEPETPSSEARAQSRVRLEQQYELAPLTATATRRAPPTRRFGKRLAIAALAAAVLIAGAIVFVQHEVDDRVGELKTVGVPKGALGNGEVGHGPVNILVVGSDSRVGLDNPEAFGTAAATGPPRSDTMFLLHIDGTSVTGLWIPRDLLVTTADGTQDMINSTFSQGPAALIAAIKSNLGVSVDHYVELNFGSFVKAVDDVGGVRIYSPGQLRDKESGLELSGPGCRTLDGSTALAWVRSRDLQLLQNGVWTNASPRADLDRQVRQQEFIRALARKAKTDVKGDPIAAVHLADSIIPALVIDSEFSRAEILGLVRTMVDIDPATFQLATVPVQASSDQAGRLVLQQPEADQALNLFRGTEHRALASPSPTVPAGAVPTPDC